MYALAPKERELLRTPHDRTWNGYQGLSAGDLFLLTNISLLHGGPRLPFGDPLAGLSQSLNELLRSDRDKKHGLFRNRRELLSASSATNSDSHLPGVLLYLLSRSFEPSIPGTDFFQAPSSLPSHLPLWPFGRWLSR